MLKKNLSAKFVFVLILLFLLILFSGCSNNNTGLPKLTNYQIIFTVQDENDIPIKGAVVTLDNEDKISDIEGIVSFTRSNGSYDYNIIVEGYITISDTTVISNGDLSIVKKLTQLDPDEHNINITIKDNNNNLVEGAVVTFDNESKKTNNNGMVAFTRPDDTYYYNVEATGYNTVNESLVVNGSDIIKVVDIKLTPPNGYIGIYDWQDLNDIRYDLDENYILMNDLNSNSSGYDIYASNNANEKTGWNPIGDLFNIFTGTLNGNNKTVSNLFIKRPDQDYVGLFGYIKGNEIIINLGLEQLQIMGRENVGGLAGIAEINPGNGLYTIKNCHSTGSISGDTYVGGLIGFNYGANITGCYSSVNVTGKNNIGGLLGANQLSSNLNKSFATGTISGESFTGGLIGHNGLNNKVEECYAVGNVDGIYNTGGLIGSSFSSVHNSYAHGDVNGNTNIGGLIGYSSSYIENSYAIGLIDGVSNIGGLVGLQEDSFRNDYIFFSKDSFSLINDEYEIVGLNKNTQPPKGRVSDASETDMQSNHIYTEYTLNGYPDMYEVWDNTIWNFGTDDHPAYPSLSWE